jgi:uncharacterized damage-inducible protein DinB
MSPAGELDSRIALLLDALDRGFDRRGWHGTTLRGSLRGITPRQALWRAGPGRPTIWQLLLHAAYWKYAVRRRLTGGAIGSFGRAPSNWPSVSEKADAAALRRDIGFLEQEHRLLRAAIRSFPPAALTRRRPGSSWTPAQEIQGVIAHDLYHTGQIQLLKRLMA